MTKPWSEISSLELKKIKAVCFDIDDTLSTDGKLTSEAYQSLWGLKKAGFTLVPVTGRPAGWCDHIARFWPVDAVVGENGAFIFLMKDEKRTRVDTPRRDKLSVEDARKKLQKLHQKILKEIPDAKVASDQGYRECDLAIDFCEDVKPWSEKKIEKLLKIAHESQAHAKVSSIHVNMWFGDYDKALGFQTYLKKISKIKKENWIFIGDSPNDEPMFQEFPMSVGVANLKKFLPKLSHPPRFMTKKESGEGFCEMARVLTSGKV